MPATKHYIVSQEREVKITANNEIDALRIADAAFSNDKMNPKHGVDGVWGNITTDIRVCAVMVQEDY